MAKKKYNKIISTNNQETVLTKKLIIDNWTIQFNLQDQLLDITCSSLEQKYKLQKKFTEVPQQFLAFCENLGQVVQLLETSGSLSIVKTQFVVSCQIGKLTKQIILELDQEDLSIEARLTNKQILIQLERQKVIAAQEKIINLQKELKLEKNKKLQELQLLQKEFQNLTLENKKWKEKYETLVQKNAKQTTAKNREYGNQINYPLHHSNYQARDSNGRFC